MIYMERRDMKPQLGSRYNVPESISPTKVIQVVGSERNEPDKRIRLEGTGDMIFFCCQVFNGRPTGFARALGSDLFAGFQLVV